jgi:aldehyde:ferredoxin oxidoreductase
MKNEAYSGVILQVDLSGGRVSEEIVDEGVMRKHIGGTGLGAKYLYENVPPGIEWKDPKNIIFFGSGPLGGTIGGTGTFSVVTKGPQTNGAISAQSNGFFGAFLRFCGFHGVMVKGASDCWVYIYIQDSKCEIRDASHLVGKDTWETEEIIAKELGLRKGQISVYSIGPAGENLVRFASIVGDRGHVVAHGGAGAVMGSKKLKAIACRRGKSQLQVKDWETLRVISRQMTEIVKDHPKTNLYKWGTSTLFPMYVGLGLLPIKNLTGAEFPAAKEFGGPNYRPHLEMKAHPCWGCSFHHCHIVKIKGGIYAGLVAEEPDYEDFAAFGSIIGQSDPMAVIFLNDVNDRLGMDANEAGWLLGMVIECYEKGVINKDDTDGIELTWGNVEAVRAMLYRIATRQGFGGVLAEGTMRAAEAIGGDAPNIGVYIKTGAAPRGHDHRVRWEEMLDVATSSTSTVDSCNALVPPSLVDIPPAVDPFNPDEVARLVAGVKGRRTLEDSLVICCFPCRLCDSKFLMDALNAVTGWAWDKEQVPKFGHMVSNLLRCFDIKHGRNKNAEQPSPRYCSTPAEGPGKIFSVASCWEQMRDKFYDYMGWDKETGRPLPETLRRVGLDELVQDIWPQK